MTTTVKQLAELIGQKPDRLLAQLKEAGMQKADESQAVSAEEKQKLLEHLRGGAVTQKITLKGKRKSTSEIKVKDTEGKAKTVAVQVKKKRVIEQPREEPVEEEEAEEEQQAEVAKASDEKVAEPTVQTETEKHTKKHLKPAPAAEEAKPAKKKRGGGKPTTNKFFEKHLKQQLRGSISVGDESQHDSAFSVSHSKIKKAPKDLAKHVFERPAEAITYDVVIPDSLTVSELAQKMSVKGGQVVKCLMKMGVMATMNEALDQDTAVLVVEEMGHKPIIGKVVTDDDLLAAEKASEGELKSRAPIVTIMGHVDHGKTSLLDFIRRTKVADSEAGGITQHIGAYHVDTDKGRITFLDTPGHAAFTAMRARGAQVTDIVILMVAADDGPMPQTLEAVQHAKAAEVPMIVAVNKIDKPEADPEKVKNDLSRSGVVPEDWGGDTMFINISAKEGQGVDKLLDAISLQAEMLELKAIADGPAQGVVVESRLEKGRGPIATILVQQGRLNKGDSIVAGMEFGRVRAMLDENGKPKDSAGPSTPVEVLGLSGTPVAGDEMVVVKTEQKAREVALFRQNKAKEVKFAKQQSAKLEDLFKDVGEAEQKSLNIVLKADVQGSVEALSEALSALTRDEVKVNVIGSGVGGINESDATLAIASNAIIFGFNVRADVKAKKIIDDGDIELRYYSVIYEIIDEVKKALIGMLDPVFKEEIVGLAEVREVFRSPKLGSIAGCMVIDGLVKRNNPIRVLRDNVVIYEGQLESLRRFKEDVQEVRSGTECGIGVKNYDDVKAGDQIEVFERVQVAVEI